MSRARTGMLYGFPERVDRLIYDSGYSYAALARRLGCDRKAVYAWKDGDTTPSGVVIVKLCVLLHTTPNYLLLGVDKDLNGELLKRESEDIKGQMHISDYPEVQP